MSAPDPHRETRRIIERVERESGGVFDSALRRTANHFAASDAPEGDAAELWGRRVGRALSLAGVIALIALLVYQLRIS